MSRADCTVRALANAAAITYELAEAIAADAGRVSSRRVKSADVIEAAKRSGIAFRKVRYSGTVGRFARQHPIGRYYARKRGHAFAIVDGVVSDSTAHGSIILAVWQVAALGAK